MLICMEGEIGVGKSSTNNHIIWEYCKDHKMDHVKFCFDYGRQVERVTTTVKTEQINDLFVMDTPGTNDHEAELGDNKIMNMKNQAWSNRLHDKTKGMSCITQCIMVDAGGRIKETSVKSMARTLHSLTYSFPEYDPLANVGPRLNLVFTKESKFVQEEDNIMIPGLKPKGKYKKVNHLDALINQFKKTLSQRMNDDIYAREELAKTVYNIDKILPKDHFYAFKIFPGMDEAMVKEKSEIQRLIKDTKSHGNWYIQNFEQASNTPASIDLQDSKSLIEKTKNFIENIVEKQI